MVRKFLVIAGIAAMSVIASVSLASASLVPDPGVLTATERIPEATAAALMLASVIVPAAPVLNERTGAGASVIVYNRRTGEVREPDSRGVLRALSDPARAIPIPWRPGMSR